MAPAGTHKRVMQSMRSTLRLRFASLPSRIIFSVFAAALVTGAAVAWVSTQSTEAFLRQGIDERFPDLLQATGQRLDHWYAQREIDVRTFASSSTVAESLALRQNRADAVEGARKYLAYVQEGFPQYRALFLLDAEARVRVWVGAELDLPPTLLKNLSAVAGARVGSVSRSGADRFQVISSPVSEGGLRLGTLHAVVSIDSVAGLLEADDRDGSAALYVVSPISEVLAKGIHAPDRSNYERVLPAAGEAPQVAEYDAPSGEYVVGSAMAFTRFGWTLVVEENYDVAFEPVVTAIRKTLAINIGIVIGFGLIALTMARSIVRPIRALSDGARRIAEGEVDIEIPRATGQDEIGVLSRALHAMVDRLRANQIELQRKQEEIERANAELTQANDDLRRGNEVLEQLSFTDGLTRLHNHRYFQDRLRMEAKRCDRSGEPLALLLVDIDDFKSLNDSHGHSSGDEVLRRVAHVVNNAVRETDLPARYGGEEFAVLAPRTGAEGAVSLAEKLRSSVAQARFLVESGGDSVEIQVTVSIGVAVYAGDPKLLFNDADRALYQAKDDGKDCVFLSGEVA